MSKTDIHWGRVWRWKKAKGMAVLWCGRAKEDLNQPDRRVRRMQVVYESLPQLSLASHQFFQHCPSLQHTGAMQVCWPRGTHMKTLWWAWRGKHDWWIYDELDLNWECKLKCQQLFEGNCSDLIYSIWCVYLPSALDEVLCRPEHKIILKMLIYQWYLGT